MFAFFMGTCLFIAWEVFDNEKENKEEKQIRETQQRESRKAQLKAEIQVLVATLNQGGKFPVSMVEELKEKCGEYAALGGQVDLQIKNK